MATETTEQLGGKKTSRLYYVDWCRSIGIHVVLLEHCINSVETATGERYINQNWLEKKDSYFRFLLQFGVPLFFFLSGMF
jgi:fucose 4-O-acetylase-like acetyltransferase